MVAHPLWSDEYWLLLMQFYLRKPVGIKHVYSRPLVDLSLELHIPPHFLYSQMQRLERLETPRLERFWTRYADSPRRLAHGVRMLRQMHGFSSADVFYDGVELCESFELDFRPIDACPDLMPVMLAIILGLYFQLTPLTMVEETPEIQELSRLMKIPSTRIVEIMTTFQVFDPYFKRTPVAGTPLVDACRDIWNRYGNDNPEKISALAEQLKEYFK